MTIIPRSNSFGVKVWNAGTRSYGWVGTFSTLEQAQVAESDATILFSGSMPTVAQWARVWLSDHARAAASTRTLYQQETRKIIAAIGELKLSTLSRPEARHLATSQWTRNTVSVARTMWADAVRDGVCERNPFAGLRLAQSRGRKDIVALTELEVANLANVAEKVHGNFGLEARAMILTLAYTGIRPGELCALRWKDVDLRAHEMHVRHSIDRHGNEKAPKNGKPRLITIPPLATQALSSLLPRDERVFHTTTGKPLLPPSLWYVWRRIAGAWELERDHIDLYSLRHAAATILLERGLSPTDVAVQLGHVDGGILVMQRYGHPSDALARDRLKMAFADSSQEPSASVERTSKSA